MIEQLYARIRQLSILVLEVSKALVPQRSSSSMVNMETVQTKISKHEHLIKLSELTLKEIVHFSNWITQDEQQDNSLQVSKYCEQSEGFHYPRISVDSTYTTNFNKKKYFLTKTIKSQIKPLQTDS